MHPDFQKLFVSPKSHEELQYRGNQDDRAWLDGKLFGGDSGASFAVEAGIPVFVPPSGQTWDEQVMANYPWMDSAWVAEKVGQYRAKAYYPWGYPPVRHRFCQELAEASGLILELASGPDGGNMAEILFKNPQARILCNDMGMPILKMWQGYQKSAPEFGPHLSFACFDALHMPIRSASLDLISSNCAFTEVYQPEQLAREAWRVLKPGGKLYTLENCLTGESLSKLPPEALKRLNLPRPGFADVLKEAGFCIQTNENYWQMPLKDCTQAEVAAEYGVELVVDMVAIEAIKV